jgi:hypothetical protein
MPSLEEQIAADLERELTRRFESTAATASIAGAGFGWHCEARSGARSCKIHCFAAPDAEYLTFFHRDAAETVVARTTSRDLTIDAVYDWLDGQELQSLYARYPFVDKEKRALLQLRDDVLAAAPALRDAAHCEFVTQFADIVGLHWAAGERSCGISFFGENALPDAKFAQQDRELLEFQPRDAAHLAPVLILWLVDQAPPSAMQAEFPWLAISNVPDAPA